MNTVHSLQGLGGRLLTERPGRTALTVAGIVLGVALFTGSLITTVTATTGLDRFTAELNGQADVIASAPGGSLSSIVTPLGGELDATTVATLASLPDVDSAFGLLVSPSAFEGPEGATQQRVNVRTAAALVGADLDAGRNVYPVEIESGRLATDGADELVLPARVADAIGVEVGDPVVVTTADGPRPIELVGVLAPRGLGRLDRIGFTSLATAQRLTDHPDQITQIAIDLTESADANAWVTEHAADVPAGVILVTATDSLRTFRTQINALNGALLVLGSGLLAIAGFLIYLTLGMAVVERTRLYGTMLALGATRRQIRRVVISEAAVIGVAGTAVGLGLGVGVAYALRSATDRLLGTFGDPGVVLVLEPWAFATAAAVGIVTTLASALVPARRAGSTDPIAAIGTTAADDQLTASGWLVALIAITAGSAALVIGTSVLSNSALSFTAVGMLLVGFGSVRAVPFVVGPVAKRIGPLIARLSPGGGQVAVQHLLKERTRSAYTLALVMVVMAMTITISAIFVSFNSSLERQLTAEFGDDLQISAASTLDEQFLADLDQVPGVAGAAVIARSTSSFTNGDTTEDIYIDAIDPDAYFDVASYPFTQGSPDTVTTAFATGPAVIVPTATAKRLDLGLGDTITMATLEGPVDFEIAAVADLINIPPEFVVDREIGADLFGAATNDTILVRVDPGNTPTQVRERIESQLADQATFIVVTASELKADTRAQVGAGINSFFVLLLLAGVVGTFGLANTMAVSVFKRYREIGVLRAIGARRRQIRAMAVIEALTLVAVAFVLALPLGALLSRPMLDTVRTQLGDITINYQTPWLAVPILAVIGVAVAIIAAAWPARRASQLDIDEALRFE